MHTKIKLENLKGRDHLGRLDLKKNRVWGCGLVSMGSWQGPPVAGSCKHSNELSQLVHYTKVHLSAVL